VQTLQAFARDRLPDFCEDFLRLARLRLPFALPEGAPLIQSSISEVIAMMEVPMRPLGRWMGNS